MKQLFTASLIFISPFLWVQCTNQTQQGKVIAQNDKDHPNIIILFADDLGYGDLGSYGSPSIQTPNIDALADQGIRFTSYEAAPWCVPSRTELMTGRYIPRISFGGATGADGTGGLPDSELTLAEGLKQAGYVTGMAGKWHLGYKNKKFLPTNQGFDSWLGLPYSNDYMKPFVQTDEPLVMYRDTTVVEYPVNQDSLTVKYTGEILRFIRLHSDNDHPFFFYLAYNMPHLPIHTTRKFHGKSKAGLYGDVVDTIDWSVGQVIKSLEDHNLTDKTIVFFASDNGPWLNLPDRMLQAGNKPWHQGTTGPLRGSKHTTFEGGSRVPAIMRWPEHIRPGQVTDALVANPDIYRTFLTIGGGKLPRRPLDGYDILPLLEGETDKSPRQEYAYFYHGILTGLREGEWKLKLNDEEPELFNLQEDVSERYNRAKENPDIVAGIRQQMVKLAHETGTKLPEEK